jgi:hypothetical protein
MNWLLAWLSLNALIFAWRLTVAKRESTIERHARVID